MRLPDILMAAWSASALMASSTLPLLPSRMVMLKVMPVGRATVTFRRRDAHIIVMRTIFGKFILCDDEISMDFGEPSEIVMWDRKG